MQFLKKLILFFSAFTLFLLSGCENKNTDPNVIRVATISGPETQLMEVAKEVAKKTSGLVIDIVEFTDYNIPNTALNDGSIDANMFQHQAFLDATIKAKNYQIVSIGKTFIYPVGIYSKKLKNIQHTPPGATIAIPNDPSNEARALLLLQKANIIKLKPHVTVLATLGDIASNPNNVKIKELDAAQLPRALDDVDLAVINSNYAVAAGLLPSKDSIFIESAESPYANIVAVKTADKNDPKFQKLLQALHSAEVKEEAKKLFRGAAFPAWKQ